MMRSLWSAATGMAAQQTNIDVIANNLANVNTVGFKASRVDFQDLVYQTYSEPGAAATEGTQVPTGVQVGLGTRFAAVQRIYSPGEMRQSGNSLDLAIEGDGFFQILLPDGRTAYTRDGAFKLDGQGRLVNSNGQPLDPEIAIPPEATHVDIGSDGTVSVTVAGENEGQQLGQITLAKFLNPAGLTSIGRNLLLPTAASGEVVTGAPGSEGIGTLAQGFIELSNVSIIEEMVNMIVAQRAYEVNSKCIQVADEMLSMANTLHR
ncbi:MAG TPA: flagellar basal-body rod protein FlgG [Armatimonadota bacterium]|nr:flagellar basal-body rod protein FlgG [Armatimonadota bacterium]